jgi:hypothetical protein
MEAIPVILEYSHVPTDEVWLAEWLAFGFAELDVYLSRHAAFAQWLARHGRDR